MTNTSNYNLKKYDLNDEVTDTILGLSENMDTLDTELKRLNDKSIVKIVASLPIIGESNALYLVPKADGQTSDIYDEYIWTGSGWEWITTKQLDVDLSNVALKSEIPTQLSQLAEDTTHRVVSDTEKTNWNNKSNFSGSYNDLTNKPTIPTTAAEVGAIAEPTTEGTSGQVLATDGAGGRSWVTVSAGEGGTTDYTALSNKPKINNVELTGNKTSANLGLAEATHTHTKAQITDLTIPTATSQLTNDSNFISSTVVTAFWTGTQAEYDALGTYSDTTLYLIKEG